ncbi:hypothetical protein M1I95_00725 [Rossellomorea marisflavi]|uniref:hypothetical protein n=1 Tax=Rossellomorea marisflavi TaxID=189381 RepID=UPI0027A048EC|nr:hypothetical protein [Rossellomorea marisflavi]UTE73103.1 hypothetical protein M1I95_00725 [Rossellomorea marisflavi]
MRKEEILMTYPKAILLQKNVCGYLTAIWSDGTLESTKIKYVQYRRVTGHAGRI